MGRRLTLLYINGNNLKTSTDDRIQFFLESWEPLISNQLVYVVVTSSVLWHVFRFISYFGLIEQPCTPAWIEEMNSKLNCKLSCTWSCNRIKLKSVKCVIFDLTYVYNPQFVPLHLYISYEESAYNKDDTWS